MKKYFYKWFIFILLISSMTFSILTATASQCQKPDLFIQELDHLSLPSGPITKDEIPQIQSTIQRAVALISEYIEKMDRVHSGSKKFNLQLLGKPGKGRDQPPLIEGLLYFKDWLNRQKCVHQSSFPLVQASGTYATKILTSYPGQVPIIITFDIKDKKPEKYDLVLFTGPASLQFVRLTESMK